MDRSGLISLHEYNAYANRLLLDVVARVPAEELNREISPSHGSARKLLVHMLVTEAYFLRCCQERPLELPDLHQMMDLRPFWENVGSEIHNYLLSLNDRDVQRIVPFQIRERQFKFPIWQMLVQSAMHSTHHRGELSILLTGLEYPLPTLDIIIHFAEESGQPWG